MSFISVGGGVGTGSSMVVHSSPGVILEVTTVTFLDFVPHVMVTVPVAVLLAVPKIVCVSGQDVSGPPVIDTIFVSLDVIGTLIVIGDEVEVTNLASAVNEKSSP